MISICGMRRGTLFILYFTYHNGIHFLRITRVYRDYTTSLDRWAGDHPTLVLNGGVDCFVFCFIVCVKDCKALVSCDRQARTAQLRCSEDECHEHILVEAPGSFGSRRLEEVGLLKSAREVEVPVIEAMKRTCILEKKGDVAVTSSKSVV